MRVETQSIEKPGRHGHRNFTWGCASLLGKSFVFDPLNGVTVNEHLEMIVSYTVDAVDVSKYSTRSRTAADR